MKLRCYGGPAHGAVVPGEDVHACGRVRIPHMEDFPPEANKTPLFTLPFPDGAVLKVYDGAPPPYKPAIAYAIYERSGDVLLYVGEWGATH